jgi:hypothetical protein
MTSSSSPPFSSSPAPHSVCASSHAAASGFHHVEGSCALGGLQQCPRQMPDSGLPWWWQQPRWHGLVCYTLSRYGSALHRRQRCEGKPWRGAAAAAATWLWQGGPMPWPRMSRDMSLSCSGRRGRVVPSGRPLHPSPDWKLVLRAHLQPRASPYSAAFVFALAPARTCVVVYS